MQIRWTSFIIAAVATLATAQPTSTPNGLSRHENSGQAVDMSIGLHPEKPEILERTLYELSNPQHERYGRHLTREEAKSLLEPSDEASDLVKRWLSDQGVPESHIEARGQWIHARVPADLADMLYKRTSGVSKRDGGSDTSSYLPSPPDSLYEYISSVQVKRATRGTDQRTERRSKNAIPRFAPKLQQKRENSKEDVDLKKCKTVLTPACIRRIYNMDQPTARPHSSAIFGVPGFNEQTAQHSQLNKFIDLFAPYAKGANFSVALVNGGENPQGEYPSGEANMDIQYAVAMTYNLSVQYIAVGGEYHDFIPDLDIPDPKEQWVEPYLEFATYLLNLPDDELPQVISISYSMNEQVLPKSYTRQVCDIFGQLGTRGVSIITAAGNRGPGASCMSNDGSNSTRFMPSFPATCPYVTTVGATQGNGPEVATDFSSGGFSDHFKRPKWQNDAVGAYLKAHGEEWKPYYNASGRAYPDVAALGDGYQIMNHDVVETTGGTSAATPLFASIIALINNERSRRGKPPMGFLNPWIYSIGRAGLTDITKGKSIGCEGESLSGLPSPVVPGAGWSAVEGWDPITGLGTPRFDRLKRLACL